MRPAVRRALTLARLRTHGGYASACRADERGAALVIALILVLVSTLLGVSVMESSTIETQLASNEEFRENVFRSAEAASEVTLEGADVTALQIAGGTTSPIVTSIDSRVSIAATRRIDGFSHVLGTSLGTFQNYLISASATASIDDLGAQRTVTQGASIRALASGN